MKATSKPTPVLEVGGTHVTGALVRDGAVEGTPIRRNLDAHATAGALLDELAGVALELGHGHSGGWGIALPGPFDYDRGIACYRGVGKFDSLHGVDVRAGLLERLGTLRPLGAPQQRITFLNDADAFGIGEFVLGAAGNSRRAACITLGTGVGSTFLADGVPVKTGPDVPPDGSCYLLEYGGRPLEDTVSRRAIRRAYADAVVAGAVIPDVREIAAAARGGDAVAAVVLGHAFAALGEAVGPYLRRFRAEVLIVGGSMAGSWDLVEPAIRKGLAHASPGAATLPVTRAERPEEAGLVGAASWALRSTPAG